MAKKAIKKSKDGKKKLPRSFIYALVAFIILPMTLFLGWYVWTAVLVVSGSQKTVEGMVAAQAGKASDAVRAQLADRAKKEGFKVDEVDSCTQIEDQYRIPQGYVFTEFSRRQLVGLPKSASDVQVQERCVIFAKVVRRMERLAHHDRHVFVCQAAEFSADDSGRYMLKADPKGRGLIEIKNGKKSLIEMKPHTNQLVGTWQVYSLGDGCLVIGMSKSGAFTMSGGVKLKE